MKYFFVNSQGSKILRSLNPSRQDKTQILHINDFFKDTLLFTIRFILIFQEMYS